MTDSQRSLHLFASYAFEPSFYHLEPTDRRKLLSGWWEAVEQAAQATSHYQLFPATVDADLLVWSAVPLTGERDTAGFFERYALAAAPHRALVRPVQTLWGYTGKSTYSKARSTQEIEPFAAERASYLIVYPFVKTADWYLMGRDARQGMMNEHIRLGKQYSAITQLLLYSFGLQNQEFVVVYETEDLPLFSDLVHELRSTEARRYTGRDTPLTAAVHRSTDQLIELWSGS